MTTIKIMFWKWKFSLSLSELNKVIISSHNDSYTLKVP